MQPLSAARPDSYPVLMKCLVATAVLGLAISYSKLYLFHMVLGVVLFRSVFVDTPGSLRDSRPLPSRFHYFFLFFMGWFALGMAWSIHRVYTLQYVGYVTVGGLISILMVKYIGTDPRRFEELFKVARFWFLVDVAVGILESLKLIRLPVSPFSPYSKHFTKLSDFSDVTMDYLETSPTGFHWNPNNYSLVMNIVLPFLVLYPKLWVRAVGAATVCYLALCTGSRGSLATAVFILVASIAFSQKNSWGLWIVLLSSVAVMGLFSSGLSSSLESSTLGVKIKDAMGTLDAISGYVVRDSQNEGNSIGVRRELIQNGWRSLMATGGLGVGGGADKYIQETMGLGTRNITSMHNYWMELLVDGGFPLIVILGLWYGALTFELARLSRHFPPGSPPRYYMTACALALIGFVPGAITASSAIYIFPQYLLYGFAIAMINIGRQRVIEAQASGSAGPSGFPSQRPPVDGRRSR
ncbi:MAG: O-antigen ligase family protein [Planctomycetales bacterium]